MHVDLTGLRPAGRPVDGLDIAVVKPADLDSVARVMCAGFEFSASLEEPVRELLEGFDPDQLVNVLATLDGEPVGCGSLWITGQTAGSTTSRCSTGPRERGVGYAVTSALIDEARARGCTESVLHADPPGPPGLRAAGVRRGVPGAAVRVGPARLLRPRHAFEQMFESPGRDGYGGNTSPGPPRVDRREPEGSTMATRRQDRRPRPRRWRADKVSELPDGPPDATGLTPRQQRVLAHIKDAIEKRGYPPSMREIGEAVGLTSSSSVAHQLKVLEEKGFLKRDPNRPRALEVFLPEVMAARRSISRGRGDVVRRDRHRRRACPPRPTCPMVGRIAAGGPILAEERVEDVFPLPKQLVGEGTLFLLEVVRRLDDRRGHLQRRLRRDPPGADRRERRDRGRDDRRRGHRQDLPAQGRPGLAAPAQRRPTTRSTAPTPRSSARSPRSCASV